MTLTINLSQPEHSSECLFAGTPIVSFFRTKYGFETPPGCRTGMSVKAAFVSIANNKVVCADNGGRDPLDCESRSVAHGRHSTSRSWAVTE